METFKAGGVGTVGLSSGTGGGAFGCCPQCEVMGWSWDCYLCLMMMSWVQV